MCHWPSRGIWLFEFIWYYLECFELMLLVTWWLMWTGASTMLLYTCTAHIVQMEWLNNKLAGCRLCYEVTMHAKKLQEGSRDSPTISENNAEQCGQKCYRLGRLKWKHRKRGHRWVAILALVETQIFPGTLKVNDTKWRQLCFEWRCSILVQPGPGVQSENWNIWRKIWKNTILSSTRMEHSLQP